MTQLLPYSVKPQEAKQCYNKLRFLLLLLPLILGFTRAFCQGMVKNKADTLSLVRYEYIKKVTNNGSDCICSISNSGMANIATVVVAGAPDSISVENRVPFNGIHELPPGGQLIAVGNFMGRQVIIMNLSLMNLPVSVMLFCPGD